MTAKRQVPSGPICTTESLIHDFRALGIREGDTLLVHSSLSSLGWVCGGAEAVVRALLAALGREGTLAVPTQTEDNSDPKEWKRPPVPEEWWPIIRSSTPAFNPLTTPCRRMGAIAEAVRTWPSAVRSLHPQTSFAAVGPKARDAMDPAQASGEGNVDPLINRLGDTSPLGRLEAMNAKVLLLGVEYKRCTSFHLAEYRVSPPAASEENSFAADRQGQREWVTIWEPTIDNTGFDDLGAAFEKAGKVVRAKVGGAEARLFDMTEAVGFAKGWLEANRPNKTQ